MSRQKQRINPEFVSPCGLYCGVCAIHIAGRNQNKKLKNKLLSLYQGNTPGKGTLPGSEGLTADAIQCNGCRSDQRFMHCEQCAIRDCAGEKRIAGCHQCDAFPCTHIEDFPMAVGKKVILRAVPQRREMTDEAWALLEVQRYHCPDCGSRVFRGAMTCNQCRAGLDLD